jgi:hypothetical protein
MKTDKKLGTEIRLLLCFFIIGLVVSGITAFPIHTQLTYAHDLIVHFKLSNPLSHWIETVYQGVHEVDTKYPFIAYGTDGWPLLTSYWRCYSSV